MKFFDDSRGNVAITTAIVGTLLLTATGAAIDGGRFIATKQTLQSVSDAAILAAMTPENISDARRLEIAQAAVSSYYDAKGQQLSVSAPDIVLNKDGQTASLSLSTEVPMLFTAFLPQESGRISVISQVEESYHANAGAVSISIVLDLTESMSDELDGSSKLESVRAAVKETIASIEAQFGGKAAAATRVSTGLYPFNWGLVDGEVTPLAAGTGEVLEALTYLPLATGSVSSEAMEQAVVDQIGAIALEGQRDRFVFYISDGKVEEDKSDLQGRYLRNLDMFEDGDMRKCLEMAIDLERSDLTLEPEETALPGNSSPLSAAAQTNRRAYDWRDNPVIQTIAGWFGIDLGGNDNNSGGNGNGNASGLDRNGKGDLHPGHDHSDAVSQTKAERVDNRMKFIEECRPTQTVRVAEACALARENNISMIGVNLSGQDGQATNIMDVCVNGLADDDRQSNTQTAPGQPAPVDVPIPARVTRSGMSLNVSADGKSFTGDVTNMEQMREILNSVLPNSEGKRSVRLVG